MRLLFFSQICWMSLPVLAVSFLRAVVDLFRALGVSMKRKLTSWSVHSDTVSYFG